MSIGQTLSAARRQAGLSIDDVSAKTRLRATVVRAIENDDFSLCGGDFYAKGHIRTLASIVGADPAALSAEFDATVATPDAMMSASQVFESEVAGRSLTKRTERRTPKWGATAAAMALIAVIVYAAVQLTHGGANNPPSVAAGTNSSARVALSSPAPSITTVTPSNSPSTPPTTTPPSSAVAEASVHIVLKVNAKCWVLASASNGEVLYQGTLQPGETKTWDDSQRISLKLGNAGATDLTVNGVDIGAPPSTTSVASVSFGPGNPTVAQG